MKIFDKKKTLAWLSLPYIEQPLSFDHSPWHFRLLKKKKGEEKAQKW